MDTNDQVAGTIYFGHPINFYNTPIEGRLVDAIHDHFIMCLVENPNLPEHDAGYKCYRAGGRRGMDYFFAEVLPYMDAGIFLPFEDGLFGKGVYGEAQWLVDNDKPIYQIDVRGNISDLLLNPNLCLSVEDTRARVYPFDEKRAEVIARHD
ncbi:hypothetical protein GOV10_01370 [Candidatus Woesearchaeota archaeon]|nr:hypothetical protein [Candidatus Woesearchaeota archaeon]